MRVFVRLGIIIVLLSTTACWNPFKNPFASSSGSSSPSTEPGRVIEATAKYSLAIGGVAPGRDEVVIYDASGDISDFGSRTLACAADSQIVFLRNRPGFDTPAAGSGVQVVAVEPGVTAVRCTLDGDAVGGVYEITVPPQNLIQILVAEAGAQLSAEAKIDSSSGSDAVALDSVSKTGDAIGSVIRNRIDKINIAKNPSLFSADPKAYDADAPVSYYDAVIEAAGQFSPVDPKDSSHAIFDKAQDRNFLDGDYVVAYDQAVIIAAGIFNGDISDSTGGSFAFRSPTAEEWTSVESAWTMLLSQVPADAGFSDATFPDLAPIQILIQPDVWKYPDGRPSFIFARSRTAADYAVVNKP
ncbi:MAG: hypothetical protein V2A66_07715 [Pseudomonadota bacterium]